MKKSKNLKKWNIWSFYSSDCRSDNLQSQNIKRSVIKTVWNTGLPKTVFTFHFVIIFTLSIKIVFCNKFLTVNLTKKNRLQFLWLWNLKFYFLFPSIKSTFETYLHAYNIDNFILKNNFENCSNKWALVCSFTISVC